MLEGGPDGHPKAVPPQAGGPEVVGPALLAGLSYAALGAWLLPLAFVTDDLQFATGMEAASPHSFYYWLPSRFLWQATGRFLFEAAGTSTALLPMQLFNLLCGGGCVAGLALLAYRLTGSFPAALAAALGYGFSYYPWSWSMHVKPYSLHLLLLLMATGMLLQNRAGALAGLSCAAALWYHQSGWLFVACLVAAAAWWRQGRFLRAFAPTLALGLGLFVLIYATYYRDSGYSLAQWYTYEWRTDFAEVDHLGGRLLPDRGRLGNYLRDLGCSLVVDGDRDVFYRFPYVVRRGVPEPIRRLRFEEAPVALRGLLTATGSRPQAAQRLGLVLFGALVAAALLSARRRGRLAGAGRPLSFCGVGAAVYFAGFLIFDWTGYLYYAVWLFLWLGLAVLLGRASPWVHRATAGLVALLFTANLLGGVLPQAFPSNHRVLRDVLHHRERLGTEAVVVCSGINPEAWYWSYFARCHSLDVTHSLNLLGEGRGWVYVRRTIDQALARGRPVYVNGLALETEYHILGRDRPEIGQRLRNLLEERYRLVREVSASDFCTLYRLEEKR